MSGTNNTQNTSASTPSTPSTPAPVAEVKPLPRSSAFRFKELCRTAAGNVVSALRTEISPTTSKLKKALTGTTKMTVNTTVYGVDKDGKKTEELVQKEVPISAESLTAQLGQEFNVLMTDKGLQHLASLVEKSTEAERKVMSRIIDVLESAIHVCTIHNALSVLPMTTKENRAKETLEVSSAVLENISLSVRKYSELWVSKTGNLPEEKGTDTSAIA